MPSQKLKYFGGFLMRHGLSLSIDMPAGVGWWGWGVAFVFCYADAGGAEEAAF